MPKPHLSPPRPVLAFSSRQLAGSTGKKRHKMDVRNVPTPCVVTSSNHLTISYVNPFTTCQIYEHCAFPPARYLKHVVLENVAGCSFLE